MPCPCPAGRGVTAFVCSNQTRASNWFWFSGATFSEAWNPQKLSIGQGMGSSISLTLWAFLGMESAAQNSDAVETEDDGIDPRSQSPDGLVHQHLGARHQRVQQLRQVT